MKVMAFNGSPRKAWNTGTLLEKALAGAASAGAETKLVHLYDLDFRGCSSCFACKTRGGRSFGACAMRDGLTPVLAEAADADAIILGSPVYFGAVTGEMKSFMERLMFPYSQYDATYSSLFPRKIGTAFILTMNVTEKDAEERGYGASFGLNEWFLKRIFGTGETLWCYDTYQFADYGKVVADRFDEAAKAAQRRDVFPQDCEKAFALGARLGAGAAV
jgi:multimeric flavodoxin WrbA